MLAVTHQWGKQQVLANRGQSGFMIQLKDAF